MFYEKENSMKIVKLFLLLCLVVWADTKLNMPNIKSSVVENVVKYGWEKADDSLKLLFETKGEKFVDDFKLLAKKPLVEQSDEEYLRESILAYSEPSMIEPEEFGLPPRVTEDKYLKQLKLTIKYDLKYMKFKRVFERDTYSYLMAYVKFLENKREFLKAYALYIDVIDRLSYIDKTVDITMLNGIRKLVFESIAVNAVKESVSHNYYTKQQINELSTRLQMVLMLNEDYWEQIILEEKRVSLAYMKIAVIEVKTFEEFVDGIDKAKLNDSEIFKNLDYMILKKYFEDKTVMEMALTLFSKKIDAHLVKLRDVKNDKDYARLENEYKQYIESYFNDFDKKIGENNKYKLSKKEFIDLASEAMYGFSMSWEMGKSKGDFIETIQKNKKFIELLERYSK